MNSIQATDEFFENLRPVTTDDKGLQLLDTTYQAAQAYAAAVSEYQSLLTELGALSAQGTKASEIAIQATRGFANLGIAQTEDSAKTTSEQMRGSIMFLIVLLIAAIVLGTVLAYFVTKSITGPLLEAADAVSNSAKEMEEAMNAIRESSDSIFKIIKTIDEIAFQTNI